MPVQEAAKRLREDPEATPLGESFDSNCITPGTPFMGRLAAHLRFFFRKKMSEDPTWQKPLIIFSGDYPTNPCQHSLLPPSPPPHHHPCIHRSHLVSSLRSS